MKKIVIASQVLLWGLLIASAFVALASLILTLIYAPEDGLLYVPFASWFVLGLSGLILILDGIVFYLWRRARTTGQELLSLQKQPLKHEIPAVCGHTKLSKAEFLVVIQGLFMRFPGIQYLHVTPLPGGYGGSTTVLVRLQPQQDEALLPQSFVVKLGDRKEMVDERDKFDKHVYTRLINTPRFSSHRYAEWGGFAGIAYEFAGLGGELQNFYQVYRGGLSLGASELIDEIYSHLDAAWYQHGQVISTDLCHEYYLLIKKRETIIGRVGRIVDKEDPYRANLVAVDEDLRLNLRPAFCPGLDNLWHDPVTFLRTRLARPLELPVHRSVVHGDLHARNILVERKKGDFKQIWFIDFSHTGNGLSQARTDEAKREGVLVDSDRGHTLRDFSRLEADVKFILTRLCDEKDLVLAVAFEKELLAQGMVLDDLLSKPPRAGVLMDERFREAWQVIREIRSRAARYLAIQTDLRPYYFSLLHATLPIVYYHPDQFENETFELQQKRYALVSAGMLCSQF